MNSMSSCCRTIGILRGCGALICLLWLGALAARAVDRYVVAPGTIANGQGGIYTNWNIAATQIQWAVDVATNTGDIVWVSNGVYSTTSPTLYGADYSVVCITNSIALKSVNGPSVTVIDATNTTRAVRGLLFTGNAAATSLSGFTIRNGRMAWSFAVPYSGAGTYYNVNPSLNVVSNCIFYNNNIGSGWHGGAIYFGTGAGGQILNCTIYSNSAAAGGGIGFSWSGASKIYNCVFWRNTAGQGGGGVACSGTHLEMKNCLFYENNNTGTDTSLYRGGGLTFVGISTAPWSFVCDLQNCTFVGNLSSNVAGGFSITSRVPFIARNVIIYDNYAVDSSYNDIYVADTNSHLNSSYTNCFTNCCIAPTAIYDLPVTQGNITNNPSFKDKNNANYCLGENSPCINTGTNQSWMTNAVDLDGKQRIRYGIVDMGAYEYIRPVGTIFTVR